MRIEKNPSFSPIHIVLESQDEVNFMHELTRNISGNGDVRNFFDSIGAGLISESTIDYSDRHFEGDLRARP